VGSYPGRVEKEKATLITGRKRLSFSWGRKNHKNKTTFTIALKDKLIEELNPNPNQPQIV
jgi:hypothetical protein